MIEVWLPDCYWTNLKFACPCTVKPIHWDQVVVRKIIAFTVMWSQVRRMGNFCSKDSISPMAFRKRFLNTEWGRGSPVCDQLMHSSLIGWWWDNRVVSQGLISSVLRYQKVWGLCAQGHQVFNFFHLVVVLASTIQEMCIRYYYLGTWERSCSGGCGGGLSPRQAPQGLVINKN